LNRMSGANTWSAKLHGGSFSEGGGLEE